MARVSLRCSRRFPGNYFCCRGQRLLSASILHSLALLIARVAAAAGLLKATISRPVEPSDPAMHHSFVRDFNGVEVKEFRSVFALCLSLVVAAFRPTSSPHHCR